MSIIQNLRDRAAWIISGAIAFALLVFVVEEGLRNKSVFGGDTNVLGKVDGKAIDRQNFETKLKKIEDRYAQMGYTMDDISRNQQRNSLWNEEVEGLILDEKIDELGIDVTDKEVGDILYGANPPQDFRQQFTDPKTQIFDPNLAYQAVQRIKSQKSSPDYRSFFGEYIPALVKTRKKEKYDALFTNSAYAPKWLIEKMSNENSQAASVSYITIPYMSIPDSTVKVTDADVKEYINAHPSSFKQEKAAAIEYVVFSGAPSSTDTLAVLKGLSDLSDSFSRTSDMNSFLLYNNSQMPFYDSYLSRREIKITAIDSILKKATGAVYGPYLDGGSYVLARVIGSRQLPDTVNVRHILIATQQRNPNGQMTLVRQEEDAKKLADSLAAAIKNGSNFDSLCAKFSDDGNKNTGGIYEGVFTGKMVAPFNDFIFTNSVGAKGVVKTEFGYHYVEVLSQKGASPAYKIAYMSRPILTSDETVNGALGRATQFTGESRTRKTFEQNAKKENLNIQTAIEIKPLDAVISGIDGNARDIVRWIFTEASKNEIAERPFTAGTSFVVPLVTDLNDEGTVSVERARPSCEFKIRQKKKTEQTAEKAAKTGSLNELAQLFRTTTTRADSVTLGNPQIPNIGFEPRVVGAAFYKQTQSKPSSAIEGESGVFFIQTEKLTALPNPNLDVTGQQRVQIQQLRMFAQRGLFENLKKAAKITDNRFKFF